MCSYDIMCKKDRWTKIHAQNHRSEQTLLRGNMKAYKKKRKQKKKTRDTHETWLFHNVQQETGSSMPPLQDPGTSNEHFDARFRSDVRKPPVYSRPGTIIEFLGFSLIIATPDSSGDLAPALS